MKSQNIIDRIEAQGAHIQSLRNSMVERIVLPNAQIEGFGPSIGFQVHKIDGSSPSLGNVGKNFYPVNLGNLLANIEDSFTQCCPEVDLTALKFNEFYGGSKFTFSVGLEPYEVKASPMVGDIVKVSILIKGGFDGLTKLSMTYFSHRLWCANGAVSANAELSLAIKNCAGNQSKIPGMISSIAEILSQSSSYFNLLERSNAVTISEQVRTNFVHHVLGYDVTAELATRAINRIDSMQASIAIEVDNTGNTAFSLLQGATRFLSRETDVQGLLYSPTFVGQNQRAHDFISELVEV